MAKYNTLDALNARWTTAYWSETYQDWRQIPVPPALGANPGLMLNWRLFLKDTWRGYQQTQNAAKFNPLEAQIAYYGSLRAIAKSMDVAAPGAALSRYRLVVAPGLNVLTPEAAANLADYVRGGGHLVLGVRSGMKDADNSLWTQRQPGRLGARVSQFYALQAPAPFDGAWGAGSSVLILINYAAEARDVPPATSMHDVLSGGAVDHVSLPRYGVAVLEEATASPR